MKISIIIPTKNRSENIEKCLEHIIKASYNLIDKEIIVVDGSDNASEQRKTETIVNMFGEKYYFASKSNVSMARNIGIKKSLGDILVFADDDFVVDKNWIINLIINYQNPKVVCCTGRMLSYRNDEASKLYEESMSFDRGSSHLVFTRKEINILNLLKTVTKIGNKRLLDKTPVPWAVGYGFYSFRKDIFDRVGYFDTRLGRGTLAVGGEDPDIFYRILKTGEIIVYEPTAVIFHNHRQDINAILKDAYNSGISVRSLTKKYFKKGDLYMFCCFIGHFFLLSFSLIKSLNRKDKNFSRMIKFELLGLLGC